MVWGTFLLNSIFTFITLLLLGIQKFSPSLKKRHGIGVIVLTFNTLFGMVSTIAIGEVNLFGSEDISVHF